MKGRKSLGIWGGRIRPGLLVGLLLAIGLLWPSHMVKADEPTPTPIPEQPEQWSTTAVDKLIAPQEEEKPARQNPKLDSTLNQLLQVRRQKGGAEAQKFAKDRAIVLTDDRVQVEIIAPEETMNDLIAAVGAVGGVYQGHYQTLLQAMVPIDALESVAQRPEVQIIRNPIRAVPLEPAPAGAVNTEGLGPANASAWHSAGSTGSGVRVAVIDGGFTNYVSRLGSDLPASVTPYDWTGTGMGGTVHGTACAEVIHDLAPGAAIDLHKVYTTVELSQAVNQAIADGVDVISMSLVWILDGPGDGTGTLASIVANARSNGILFVTGAGNGAQVSWSGTFSNDGSGNHLWTSGQNINYFGPGGTTSCYNVPAGFPIIVGLHWDDWTSVNQDYDLQLYRWTGSGWSLVTGSSSYQNGGAGQTPEEYIAVYAPSTACYGVLVRRYNATRNVCLRLIAPTADHLDEWVTQRSLPFPADSPNALTVGAVEVSSYNLEPYSSRGPIFGSGGTCSGGGTNPDMVGYANVSTVSYGSGGFNGTSAATPHVAGAAALVLGANPSYSVSQLQSYLENNAVDLGSSGKDNLYGAGRLRLGSPPPAAPSSLTATPVSASEINLTWIDNSSNETGFKIERSPNGTSGWTQIATVAANITTYANTGLTCGASYYYRVRASNSAGNSNYSNIANATPPCSPTLVAPSNLTAARPAPDIPQINLNWQDNSTNETGFKIERSPNGASNWTQIATVGVNVNSYFDVNAGCGNSFYQVRAYNAAGNSLYSNLIDAPPCRQEPESYTLYLPSIRKDTPPTPTPTPSPPGTNLPPEFPNPMQTQINTQFQYNPSGQLMGAVTTISISAAIDPNGDPLTYSWSATNGSITGNSTSATWRRVIEFGRLKDGDVTVVVQDGRGGSDSFTIKFQ